MVVQEYASLIRKTVKVVGSGLLALHWKSVLMGELFTIYRNWLTLGGAAPPGLAKSQM